MLELLFVAMERAGRVLRRLRIEGLAADELLRAAWPHAVGKRIASHTRVTALYGTRLVVEVEDPIWKAQLQTLEGQILPKLRDLSGHSALGRIEFREIPPKVLPQRAAQARRSEDEANEIEDPVLRMVYRASRKRSLA